MKFIDMFIEDCKYYNPENMEVKTILKNVNLKEKIILDIGAGVGRLSFPLSKYAKEVIALDKDRRFRDYFKKRVNTKYTYPNEKIAFRVLKNSMKLWFNTKFNAEKKNKLKDIIKQHKRNNKIIFQEKIYFYILKK